MKKLILLAVFATLSLVLFGTSQSAHASSFEAGRIIDDSVLTDASSMNAQQIQQFLESKVPACDTWGAQTSEYGGGTRRQWAEARGHSAPFTCLRDYTEGGKSASQLIYEVSQQFSISPKVMIVLLQKEQGLVTDVWPLAIQYRSATGYGCPDTAACDSQYYGLTNQLTWAARMFRAIMNNSSGWYTPYVLGNNYIRYSPDSSCGGSTVYIQNRATQALYNYTPYQPNAGALAAGWGTASCGAYGNRNFYLYYTNWFGDTTAAPSYGYSVVSREFYSDANYQNRLSDTPSVEPGSTFYVRLIIKNTGNQTWYKNILNLGGEGPRNRYSDFATTGWLNPGRPATINEATVAGGANGTFTFAMKAPTVLGTYQEQFGVLIEGQRWLDGTNTIPVTVASSSPYYSTQVTSFNVYSDSAMTNKIDATNVSLYTRSKLYVKTQVKNTGNQPFPATLTKVAATNPIDRTSVFADGTWTNTSRVVGASEGTIAPGATGTFSFSITAPSASLARQTEQFGVLIEGQRWLNTNIGSISIQTNTRPPSEMRDGDILEIGSSLLSLDERYTFILQGDGNLVLYKPGGRAIWSSGTVGKGAVRLVMQYDGNLVLYRADWTPVWYSSTAGNSSSALIPQSDGNLVLYKTGGRPTWWSGTAGQQ